MKNPHVKRRMAVLSILTVITIAIIAGLTVWLVPPLHQRFFADVNPATKVGNDTAQSNTAKQLPDANTAKPVKEPDNTFKIPELGIKMVLPKGLEDLEYAIVKDPSDGHLRAGFSTKTLINRDGADTWCIPEHNAIGSIYQWQQDPGQERQYMAAVHLGLYYYTFVSPQTGCSDKTDLFALQEDQSSLLRKAYDSITIQGKN